MSTVAVTLRESNAYLAPAPTRTGIAAPTPSTLDVEISDDPRPARPGRSQVVSRGGGRITEWDGTDSDRVYLLVSAPTESGMRAHPISGTETMSAGALQSARESLGLTGNQFAALLTNSNGKPPDPRTVRSWEQGRDKVPSHIHEQVVDLLADSEADIFHAATRLVDEGATTLVVYRTDDEFRAAHPELRRWSARWWRHAATKIVADHGRRFTIVSAPTDPSDA